MSEMSEGAKAAWERWQQDDTEQNGKLYGSAVFMQRQAFAAGFADCLAALSACITHLQERERECKESGNRSGARAYHSFARELMNAEMWIKENITCNLPEHPRCQEANKR